MDERAKATSLAVLNKAITTIARSAVKLNDSIHNVGVMAIEHAKTYGDCTPAARLVDAMPKTHRRNLLIDWFDAFSPIGIARDTKSDKMKGFLRGKADERDKLWNVEGAKATPFFAMPAAQTEPEVPTFESFHGGIVAFINRMEKKVKGTDDKPGIKDPDELKKAEAELDRLKKAIAIAA